MSDRRSPNFRFGFLIRPFCELPFFACLTNLVIWNHPKRITDPSLPAHALTPGENRKDGTKT